MKRESWPWRSERLGAADDEREVRGHERARRRTATSPKAARDALARARLAEAPVGGLGDHLIDRAVGEHRASDPAAEPGRRAARGRAAAALRSPREGGARAGGRRPPMTTRRRPRDRPRPGGHERVALGDAVGLLAQAAGDADEAARVAVLVGGGEPGRRVDRRQQAARERGQQALGGVALLVGAVGEQGGHGAEPGRPDGDLERFAVRALVGPGAIERDAEHQAVDQRLPGARRGRRRR